MRPPSEPEGGRGGRSLAPSRVEWQHDDDDPHEKRHDEQSEQGKRPSLAPLCGSDDRHACKARQAGTAVEERDACRAGRGVVP